MFIQITVQETAQKPEACTLKLQALCVCVCVHFKTAREPSAHFTTCLWTFIIQCNSPWAWNWSATLEKSVNKSRLKSFYTAKTNFCSEHPMLQTWEAGRATPCSCGYTRHPVPGPQFINTAQEPHKTSGVPKRREIPFKEAFLDSQVLLFYMPIPFPCRNNNSWLHACFFPLFLVSAPVVCQK